MASSILGLALSNRKSGKQGGFGANSFAKGLGLMGLDMFLGSKKVVDGPRLEDRSVQVAEYGWRPPTIYGTHRTAGAMIWAPPSGLTEHSQVRRVGGGKQNGSVREFSYAFNGAMMVCDVPIEYMAEMTYNDKIIYTNNGVTEVIDSALAPPSTADIEEDPILSIITGTAGQASTQSAQTTYNPTTNTWSRGEFRIYGGSMAQMPDALIETDLGVGRTPAYRGKTVVVFEQFYIVPPLGVFGFTVKSKISQLTDVCEDLWGKAGIGPERLDLSQIESDEVDGFIIDDRSQVRDALEELAQNHLFDWVSRDGKQVALPRGGGIITSIPAGSLRVRNLSEGGSGGQVPQTIFSDADTISIPMREELQFHDAGRNYHPNIRSSWRDATPYREYVDKHARSTSEVLSRPMAQKLVNVSLFESWAQAQSFNISLGTEYRHLAAGDVVSIPHKGISRRVRLVEAQKHQFGTLSWKAVPDGGDLYNGPLGEDTDPMDSETIQSNGSLSYVFLNTNPWADNIIEDYPAVGKLPVVIWAATVPEGAYWNKDLVAVGSSSFLPYDNDYSISTIGYFAQTPAIMGKVASVLPDYTGGSSIWDYTSTVDVDLIRGSLSSITDAETLAGVNKIYIGAELVYFRDADYLGTFADKKRYRISNLLRGRRGTEWAMATHTSDDPAIFVNSSVKIIQMKRSLPNQEIDLTIYTPMSTSFGSSTTVRGCNLMPFSPVHIKPTETQPGDGGIRFNWDNRTRFNDAANAWWSTGQEPPLGEYSEKYEVEILNGLGGVVYTIRDLTTPEATYTAARQMVDFGSLQTSIDIKVYQISQVVGRGYAGSATITP